VQFPAASTFSVQASTGDGRRSDTSKLTKCKGVTLQADSHDLRQEAIVTACSRPPRATESAAGALPHDPDLAAVVAAWPELLETVRAAIIAMVEATRMQRAGCARG
jgi:hypothetical protein